MKFNLKELTLVLTIFLSLSRLAFAQCPDLAGEYICQADSPFYLKVQQRWDDDHKITYQVSESQDKSHALAHFDETIQVDLNQLNPTRTEARCASSILFFPLRMPIIEELYGEAVLTRAPRSEMLLYSKKDLDRRVQSWRCTPLREVTDQNQGEGEETLAAEVVNDRSGGVHKRTYEQLIEIHSSPERVSFLASPIVANTETEIDTGAGLGTETDTESEGEAEAACFAEIEEEADAEAEAETEAESGDTLVNSARVRSNHKRIAPYRCEVEGCGKSYRSASGLSQHRPVHDGNWPYFCPRENCGKGFANKSNFNYHLGTHGCLKLYACDFDRCDASSRKLQQLNIHRKRHQGPRPYACNSFGCSKGFATYEELEDHRSEHSRQKPFPCPFEGCERSFNQSSSLANHKRTHNDERPFKCSYSGCTKAFKTLPSRKQHEKALHDLSSIYSMRKK